MAQDIITITAGDRKPSLVHTLKDTAGATITLSSGSDTVKFRLVHAITGAIAVNDATAQITSGSDGQVTYDWTGNDTSVSGMYFAQWRINWAAGPVQHIREPFWIDIRDKDPSRVTSAGLVSLGYARSMLDLRSSEHDYVLLELIRNCTRFLGDYVGYNLIDQTYTHDGSTAKKLNGNGRWKLPIQHRPVTAISAASILNEVAISLTDPLYFAFDSTTAEAMLLDGRVWTRGIQNVSMTYRAGYSIYDASHETFGSLTMPGSIMQVAAGLLMRKYQEWERKGPQVTDIRIGDYGVSYTLSEFTKEQRAMLQPYRAVDRMVSALC